jgi:predicted DCC family thiol-disulfide oxidoreductase YuxK
MPSSTKPLVVYDGFCVLCDHSVSFLQARQRPDTLQYAAQHSERGQRALQATGLTAVSSDTIILVENGRSYQRSSGVLRAFRYLKFPWPLMSFFLIVPPFIRDRVYNLVAHNRYRWFGRLPRE